MERFILDEGNLNSHCKPIEYEVNDNGCYICTSHTQNKSGYPTIHRNHKCLSMSRFIYEQKKGPIPPNNHVLHSCDNPCCINPDHLFLGTNLDNIRDKVNKGRQAKGSSAGSAKLKEEQVLEIKTSSLSDQELAQKFNVSKVTIHRIRTGTSWKHWHPELNIKTAKRNRTRKLTGFYYGKLTLVDVMEIRNNTTETYIQLSLQYDISKSAIAYYRGSLFTPPVLPVEEKDLLPAPKQKRELIRKDQNVSRGKIRRHIKSRLPRTAIQRTNKNTVYASGKLTRKYCNRYKSNNRFKTNKGQK